MQLPDDPRETLCLHVWWAVIRESTSTACFSPASFIAWSRSKQNTWSPPQMGSACRVQSGALAATRCQIRAGDSPSPPALHIIWELGFSHRPCLQPRPCSSRPLPQPVLIPFTTKASVPALLGSSGHAGIKLLSRNTFSKPRTDSDWTSLGHMLTSEPIAVVVEESGSKQGAGPIAVNFQPQGW